MKWNSFVLNLILAASAIGASSLPAAAQSSQQNADARKLYVEGRDLLDDGKNADAEKKFREALTKYPKYDRADQTAYYLITTLKNLGRVQDSRMEIDNFRKNYPSSRWKSDVEEMSLVLNGSPFGSTDRLAIRQPFGNGIGNGIGTGIGNRIYTVSPPDSDSLFVNGNVSVDAVRALAEQARSSQAFIGRGGNNVSVYTSAFPANASLESQVLRMIIEKDPDHGIELAKERLKTDPSDPAVIANLSTIASSNSSQALPFLLSLLGSTANPNARSTALFYVGRRNGDKDQVAKALMEMLAKKETEAGVVGDALTRLTSVERRAALDQIALSQNAERVAMLEKLYRSTAASVQLRGDILQAVAKVMDAKALNFIADVAQNEKDLTVRRAAVQALAGRKDADVKTLENVLKALPRTPSPPAPVRSVTPLVPATPVAPAQPVSPTK